MRTSRGKEEAVFCCQIIYQNINERFQIFKFSKQKVSSTSTYERIRRRPEYTPTPPLPSVTQAASHHSLHTRTSETVFITGVGPKRTAQPRRTTSAGEEPAIYVHQRRDQGG